MSALDDYLDYFDRRSSDLLDVAAARAELAALRTRLEDAEKLRTAVLAWWNDHRYDTIPDGDGDEYNMFDEEPKFVKLAIAHAAREALKGSK